MTVTLKGMTWSHPRGLNSLLASSRAYSARNPDTEVEWDARSLQDFADYPLEDLVSQYDLLVFDHPFVGEVAASELLLPLDVALSLEFLADQAANSVGRSHASYQYGGHQWALAVDAACHVSVERPDLVGASAPQNWDDVVADARDRASRGGPRMAIPLLAIDAFLSFVTLLVNDGNVFLADDGSIASPDRAEAALERLAELRSFAHPESLRWNPVQMLEAMTTTDEIAFSPITFGYVNYSTSAVQRHTVAFHAIPEGTAGRSGGVCGGAGLGVSGRSRHADAAAQFAAYVASRQNQTSAYVDSGGQPGHRAAWTDATIDRQHGGFFSGTLAGIDSSYLRPQWSGYLAAQTDAASRVHAWLSGDGSTAARLVAELSAVFSSALAASPRGAADGTH